MELYMIVKDAELIRRLMATHTPSPITARQITRALGFKGHSYMNRVLNGQQRSVKVETANKIAYMLGVPVDLLFVAKASGESQQNVQRKAS
jgi:hypothetical protein